jgi:mono/diheme cytochrome c family protein
MNRRRLYRAFGLPALVFTAAALVQARPQQTPETTVPAPGRQAAAAADSAGADRALVNKYCAGCHSEKAKQGNFVISTLDPGNVGTDAERWELVVRKLRARSMPPPGRPRPDEAGYDALIAHLESSLDRFAAANPDPGRTDTFRRLNRTEYQNAIRDLLAVAINVDNLLPSDDSSHGFDNISVGGLSPMLLERYLSAAQKISRLAVGTPVRSAGAETVILPADLTQETHFDGQPFGTRAGASVSYTFPADGEYQFEMRLTRDRNELIEGLNEPHQIEVSIDGVRQQVFTLKPASRGNEPVDPVAPQYAPEQAADSHLNFRVPVKGGPHVIQVAFLKRPSALIETERQPYLASFNSDRTPRTQPALYSVSIAGPFNQTGIGDTPSRQRIFSCQPAKPTDEQSCAAKIVTTLARRAYRRPATNDEIATLLHFYTQGRADGSFELGIEMALRAMLTSPAFLFRVESGPAFASGAATAGKPASAANAAAAGKAVAVSAYGISDLELASRLSFFLWSSIPDDALLDVAVKGKLDDPAVLDGQVRRMLADPRANALVNNFAAQWLYLRNLDSHKPDNRLFPDFDDNLRQAFRRETEMLFESVMKDDRSVLDLVRADYTFLNERLAKHYGIPNVYGSHFRRVSLGPNHVRGGLLGQGSIMTVTSYANRTSPVRRGSWILENLLGTPVPPPPQNVPPLPENNPGEKVLTVRERMVQHRANPSCASCHRLMDPVGLATENFDAIGRWRTQSEAGTPVDASGGLPDGSTFDGAVGLRKAVLTRPDLFVTTLTEKLMIYALGRGLEYYDAPAVRAITRTARASDYRFSSVILGIVKSTPFRMRRAEANVSERQIASGAGSGATNDDRGRLVRE